MRKIISVTIVVLLLNFIFPFIVNADYVELRNSLTLDEFSESLNEMVLNYWPETALKNSAANTENESEQVTLTNRLIIKTYSNDPLDNYCAAIDIVEGYDCLHILQFENESETNSAYEFYNGQTYVDYVEQDFIFHRETSMPTETTSATDLDNQWSVIKTGSKAFEEAIDGLASYLPQVKVAIFDSGLDADHEFFDADRIEDSHVNLFDIKNPNADTSDDSVDGHGTHIAGIIYNNTPSNVIITPYKVTNSNDDFDYAAIAEIIPKAVSNGVNVINMSYGFRELFSGSLENNEYKLYRQNVQKAIQSGVVVVVAAHNFSDDAKKYFPANIEEAITVSAVEETYVLAGLSNYGKIVDIAAPGMRILSTLPNNAYGYMDGTSMAAPFVVAAAAIIKSLKPTLNAIDIQNILLDSKNVDSLPYSLNKYGVGVVNFLKIAMNLDCERLKSPILALPENDNKTITLTLDSQTEHPDAEIYYTVDNTFPTQTSTNLYVNSIDISSNDVKTITAVTYANGILFSKPIVFPVRWSSTVSLNYKDEKSLPTLAFGASYSKCVSSNPEIAEVSNNGTVKGLKRGSTTITASTSLGQTISYKISVNYTFWDWLIIILLFGWAWYI